MNRREFGERMLVLLLANVFVSCGNNPLEPEPPKPRDTPPAPTLNYIRTNVTAGNEEGIKLLDAIRPYSPMGVETKDLNRTYNDFFVNGFAGTPYNKLVFYINNERYEDLGVQNKKLAANVRWGCLQI